MTTPAYDRAQRATAPADLVLTALEIRHPGLADPVRVVNATEDHVLAGRTYTALRFDARLVDDAEGRVPTAEFAIDNVGRSLTEWVERAGGGAGATVRVTQWIDRGARPEWDVTLDVASMHVDAARVTARLGYDPLLGRPAVRWRFDPHRAPGLF